MIDRTKQTKKELTITIVVVVLFLIAFLVLLTGCATIEVKTTDPKGNPIKYKYTRLGDQSIEGLKMKSPNGWELSFDKQLSDIEIAFGLGAASVKVGDIK